jgi:hypothetical protein
MQGWQIAVTIIGIGISSLGISIYFRVKEIKGTYKGKHTLWKLLFITAVLVILEGIILLILPENIWWAY